jgi:hypothetical protein
MKNSVQEKRGLSFKRNKAFIQLAFWLMPVFMKLFQICGFHGYVISVYNQLVYVVLWWIPRQWDKHAR